MAGFDKEDLVKGALIAAGVLVLAPALLPVAAAVAKPLGRALARSGKVLYDRGTEAVLELGEVAEDFVAEVKAEASRLSAAQASPKAPPPEGVP